MLQVRVPEPPAAVSVALYEAFLTASKRVLVVITRTPVVIENAFVALLGGLAESVTRTVNEYVAGLPEAVPVIAPAGLNVKPDGNGPEPEARVQVRGKIPPVALNTVE